MALSVLNNIPSLVAQNNLAVTNSNLQNTLFQLSSGSRINSGADDPAGLSIADGLQANISALTQSSQNATDGVGQLQVADGALSQVTTLLNRAVTLGTEAANGGLTADQFSAITNEYSSILAEINRIGNATNFNGNSVFSSATAANPNEVASTAPSALAQDDLLTAGTTTTVQVGGNPAYTFTASATQHTDLNQLVGATDITGGLTAAIAANEHMTITTGTGGSQQSYTYTAPAGGSTVGAMITAINSADIGVNAALNASNQLVLTDAEGHNDIAVSANNVAEVGAFTNAQTGSTVQDLINGINGAGLGVTASLASVSNPNLLSGATTGLTGATSLAGDSLTITAGPQQVGGGYAQTYTYTASTTDKDPVLGTTGTDTVQGLIDSINASNTGFHACLNSAGALQITDENYNGNIAASGSVTSVTGALANPAATEQLVITDPQNRGNLAVTNNDAALGFVSAPGGNPLEGGNADSFVAPEMSGSGGAHVFISDGEVSSAYNTISVQIGQLSTTQIGSNSTTLSSADLSTASGAASALTVINNAISDLASMRGTIGAGINRLNSATNVINTQIQNLTSAQSSIQDANVGQVVANLSKYQILEQTGISALAQANQNQQAVLKLLQ